LASPSERGATQEIFNSSDRFKDPHVPKHSYRVYKSLRDASTMFDGLLATWT
jgi:hypothetical protein